MTTTSIRLLADWSLRPSCSCSAVTSGGPFGSIGGIPGGGGVSGICSGVHASVNANRPLKPATEWNQSRVVVRGTTVEHWLNGTKVLSYELGSPALKSAVAQSKFKDVARFGTPQKGHILVQDHGDQVWYKSIRIRPLSASTH